MRLQGAADFLARPYPAARVEAQVENITLENVRPILSRYGVYLNTARVDAAGQLAYSPQAIRIDLNQLRVYRLHADYIHTGEAQEAQNERENEADDNDTPELRVHIGQIHVQGEVGIVNKTTDPDYRLFLSEMDLMVENLSLNFGEGPATVSLTGKFMGSGPVDARGTFRSDDPSPDFDLNIKIEDTDLTTLNDVLRAYGNFDVHGGTFALFSELAVKNNEIDGYVRPLFEDVDVYDRREDADKSLFQQLYRGLLDGLATLLARQPDDVVTGQTEIEGEVEDPEVKTWQLVVTIIQNAFLQAILPEFDEVVSE